jgi:hypothetical protein
MTRPVAGRLWGHAEVDTLRQAVGSRLAWRLDLGEEPYLRLAALGSQRHDCRGEFVAAVRDGTGASTELLRTPMEVPRLFGAADRELDLSAWSGQSIDLLLSILPEDGAEVQQRRWRPCRGVWAGPAVYSLVPSPPTPHRAGPPNVVLIGLDTFRADHWTSRPARRISITPALDRLAAASDVWLDAYSTVNNTNPSFISVAWWRSSIQS